MIKSRKLPESVVKVGDEIAGHLLDASIQHSTGVDLGGCPVYNLTSFPHKYRALVSDYVHEKIQAVEAIYLAMEEEMKKHDKKRIGG